MNLRRAGNPPEPNSPCLPNRQRAACGPPHESETPAHSPHAPWPRHFLTGCATRTTSSGGRETIVLGGAVSVSSESFQPVTPVTINADTSKIAGKADPSGRKVSLLWGLITLHDY